MSKPKKRIFGNKYEYIQSLESGGFGEVLLAENMENKELYAIKCLKKEKFSQSAAKSFNREIDILFKLSEKINDYVPHLYDYSKFISSKDLESKTEEERKKIIKIRPFFAMEYLKKGNLFNYINYTSNGLGEQLSKLIFKKIVYCIKYCHENDIAHLDIKLKNILLDDKYNIKITDFGLSEKIEKDLLGKIIESKGNKGTKSYKCPEMWEKKQFNCIKADVFSLGVTLFLIVTRTTGFHTSKNDDYNYKYIINKDNDKDNINKFWKAIEDNYIGYNELSDEFKKLYLKMIAYEPDKRPSLEEILVDPWLKEINDMNVEQLNNLEQMGIKKFKDLEETMESANTIGAKGNKDNVPHSANKSITLEKQLFNNDLLPNKLNNDKFDINNGIIIEGYIDAVNFMNTLAEKIKGEYKEECVLDKLDDDQLKFYVIFEKEENEESNDNKEEDEVDEKKEESKNDEIRMIIELLELKENNRYFVNFIRGNGDLEDHYEYFIKIREIIKELI